MFSIFSTIDFQPGSEFGVDDYPGEKQSFCDDCRYIFLPCLYQKSCNSSKSSSSGKKKKPRSSTPSTKKSTSNSSGKGSSNGSGGGGTAQTPVDAEEQAEAGTKLLAIATDDLENEESGNAGGCQSDDGGLSPGTLYRGHPSPSAPQLEYEPASGVHFPPSVDNVKYSRQFSQPVQATS